MSPEQTGADRVALDGEQFRLWFWDAAGECVATVWEPYERTEEVGPWIELINSMRGAAGLVPRAFVAG